MTAENQKERLERLTGLINQLSDDSGNWSLTDRQIAAILDIPGSEFYTRLYNTGNPLLSLSFDTVSQNETGLLVSLLEEFGYDQAESFLKDAGYFIPLEMGTDFQELFLSLLTWKIANHCFRYEEFHDMLKHFQTVRKPLEIYLEQYFPINPIKEESAKDFLAKHREIDPEPGRRTLLQYLEMLEQRKILVPGDYCGPLKEELVSFARAAGFQPEWERPESRRDKGTRQDPVRRAARKKAEAILMFGFSGTEFTREELKIRYKNLMKKYHPDINPEGLNKCQDINAAYTLLIKDFEFYP